MLKLVQPVYEPCVMGILRYRIGKPCDFTFHIPKSRKNSLDFLYHRAVAVKMIPLLQIADLCVLRHEKLPLVAGKFSCEHIQQGGFAGAVSADDTHLVSGVQMKARLIDDDIRSVCFCKIIC